VKARLALDQRRVKKKSKCNRPSFQLTKRLHGVYKFEQHLAVPNRRKSEGLSEAERRISDCIKTQKQDLDLRGLKLDILPESARELTWLVDLDASDNLLTELPE
jgi:hypothetical protein